MRGNNNQNKLIEWNVKNRILRVHNADSQYTL